MHRESTDLAFRLVEGYRQLIALSLGEQMEVHINGRTRILFLIRCKTQASIHKIQHLDSTRTRTTDSRRKIQYKIHSIHSSMASYALIITDITAFNPNFFLFSQRARK